MSETSVQDEAEAAADALVRRRRGRRVVTVCAAALAAVLVVVGLLGGFADRRDLFTTVAPGTIVTAGPYELSFSTATLQHKTSSDEWEVVATGTGRTTGDTTINPGVTGGDFVYAHDLSSSEVQSAYLFKVGDEGADSTANLVPGLPAVPVSVIFELKREPGPEVLVAIYQLEYGTPYVLSQEKGWQRTTKGSRLILSLRRLPDEEY